MIVTTQYHDRLEIRLDHPEYDCWVCGVDCSLSRCGIPVYEDFVLPNDWQGDWMGAPACRDCFTLQELLTRPMTVARFKQIRGIKAATAAGGE